MQHEITIIDFVKLETNSCK